MPSFAGVRRRPFLKPLVILLVVDVQQDSFILYFNFTVRSVWLPKMARQPMSPSSAMTSENTERSSRTGLPRMPWYDGNHNLRLVRRC